MDSISGFGNNGYQLYSNNGSSGIQNGMLETSNTNVAESMVNQMVEEKSFEANAQTIQTNDEMMKSALDILA